MIPFFTHPWALLLLVALPPLAWAWWGHTRAAWQFSDHRLLPPAAGVRVPFVRWGGLCLRLGSLVLLILAVSGPRWIDETERMPTDGISIAMVLDVSVSMNEKDFALDDGVTTRLLGVKDRFRLFVAGGDGPDGVNFPGRKSDLIGLVTYATHPETTCPLTLEHGTLLKILDAQEPLTAAGEGTTNPGDAIAWALHLLKRAPTRRKVLVFLTDGESNVPQKLTPRQAAQLAANLSIPIYAIDASPEPKNDKERQEVELARDTLQTIAKMTDGSYFRAQDGRGLVKAYESIDGQERDRILSFQYRRYLEGFAWFALAALACWMLLIALEATVWRTTP